MPTWSNLAFWMLVVTSGIAAVRLLRQRVPHRGWLVVLGVVVALALAGRILLQPGWIGAALGVWFLLVWLPSVLMLLVRQLSLRERYRGAAILARAAALLHPCDGWWQTPDYLHAFRLARSGDLDGAARGLERLSVPGSPYADRARVHLGRLTQRWDDVVAWSRERPDQVQRDSELFAMVLRAHGETGDTAGMVDAFERHRCRRAGRRRGSGGGPSGSRRPGRGSRGRRGSWRGGRGRSAGTWRPPDATIPRRAPGRWPAPRAGRACRSRCSPPARPRWRT